MKTLIASACVMWIALAIELSCRSRIPQGSLFLPIICGVMVWTRSAAGLMLSGLVLLLEWIARPGYLPLCPMLLPFVTVFCLAPSVHNEEYRPRKISLKIPSPLQLPMLTLAAVTLQTLGSLTWTDLQFPRDAIPELTETLKPLLIIALPLSAMLALVIRLADELGMRRSYS